MSAEPVDKRETDSETGIDACESPCEEKSQNKHNNETESKQGRNKDTAERPGNDKEANNGREGGGVVAGDDGYEPNGREIHEQKREREIEMWPGLSEQKYTCTDISQRRESLKELGSCRKAMEFH